MQRPYYLPPKEILFKMLDKDMKLIVKNYGFTRPEAWKELYRTSIEKDHSPRARETALNSEIEVPRCVPDLSAAVFRPVKLVRHRSVGSRRRKSSLARKVDISAYKVY